MSKEAILDALKVYCDPVFSLAGAMVQQSPLIEELEERFSLTCFLGFPLFDEKPLLKARLEAYLSPLSSKPFEVDFQVKIKSHAVQGGVAAHPKIKNCLVVGSGKGGVGKSSIAVNLALGLAAGGARVGLLDADIYGPSIPLILGTENEKPLIEDKRFLPIQRYGIEVMSIGYLVKEEDAMIWRGPMVSGALMQLLNETAWSDLDYLIIDLPPGTGDIQLTLAQKIPVSGAIIVTTPQKLALIDAKKAISMFKKVEIPILGLVENMSADLCAQCGEKTAIFGQGGGLELGKSLDLPLLAQVPLKAAICGEMDSGRPPVLGNDPLLAALYRQMALKTALYLSQRKKNLASAFSKVTIVKKD